MAELSPQAIKVRPLSRVEVRAVDERAVRDYGMPGLVLMENAGRGAAEKLYSLGFHGKVVILAGLGNNGGDGFVMARHWELICGEKPIVFLVASELTDIESKMSEDARTNYRILLRAGFQIEKLTTVTDEFLRALSSVSVIVDALLGTGARGELRRPMREIVAMANRCGDLRVAVDIPSGLDCDSGEPGEICFRADHTLTFVAPKIGFGNERARSYVGQVHIIDIGVPFQLLEEV